MTVEYIVLGAVLIVMGGLQAWLRHGPWSRQLRAEQEEVAARRAERAKAAYEAAARLEADADGDDSEGGAPEYDAVAAQVDKRAGKAWSAWTAILGGVAVAFGVAMLVLGVLGY
jgi:hypothetical protein